MRWYILRTLLLKEVLRHLANRGGIFLIVLLIGASLLLSVFGQDDSQGVSVMGGVKRCYVDVWEWNEWVDHLAANPPEELRDRLVFRRASDAPTRNGKIVYPANTGSIQVRPDGQGGYRVMVWHPGRDASGMAPFEAWFWRQTRSYQQQEARHALRLLPPERAEAISGPEIEQERHSIAGGLDPRSGIATALVWFGLFFVCVYLMPSLTAEERERGVLLAQALSPASAREILGAKFLFYPVLALALAAVVGGTYNPAVLTSLFFWLTLAVAVAGTMGIGLTIASVAKTQRAASMGAMCYLFAVTLVIFICEQVNIKMLPYLALEYHCPRIIHASLGEAVQLYHWGNLAGAGVLATGWTGVATFLFRRYGWQS